MHIYIRMCESTSSLLSCCITSLEKFSLLKDSSIDSSSYVGRRPDSLFGWLGSYCSGHPREGTKSPEKSWMPKWCEIGQTTCFFQWMFQTISKSESFLGRFFPSYVHKSPRQQEFAIPGAFCCQIGTSNDRGHVIHKAWLFWYIFCLGLVWIAVQKRALTKK